MQPRRSSTMPSAADTARMSSPIRRVCAKTGLALTAGPASALRIARESYGPLSPVPRETGDDPGAWSRYDTPGRTVYATADRVTAYMELLAPYRTDVDQQRRALQPIATAMGMELEELWRDVVEEWDTSGTMKANWLPRTFREGRTLYELRFRDGWWIDITSTETIAALHGLLPPPWPMREGWLEGGLTISHLTGDDRTLTTAIATALREEVSLDDGTLPLGIEFPSKHGHPSSGTGMCWAYWMRDVDGGLTDPTTVMHGSPIRGDDGAFNQVLNFCNIRAR